MDANSKLGNEIIKNDPNKMSGNGKTLKSIIDRQALVVVNASDKCKGTITREKKVLDKIESSVIDYFIVCQSFYEVVNSMEVDEERKRVLTSYR